MMLSASNAEDFDAIDRYIRQKVPQTPAAQKLQNDWIKWSDSVTWLGKGWESNIREAENRRNAFNIANFKTPQEVNEFKEMKKTSVSREEMQGKPRVVDSAGNYPKSPGITVASAAKGSVLPGSRPTIRQGSKGDIVKSWQAIIGVATDGNFGPATAAATKVWQAARGLIADGIVGSATWAAALKTEAPHMPLSAAQTTPVAPVGVKPSAVKPGQVIPAVSIKTIAPTKPAPKKPVTKAIKQASLTQVVKEPETLLTKFKEASTPTKIGIGAGVAFLAKWLLF